MDNPNSFSYLDLDLEMDNEGQIRSKYYSYKRDDFNFPIVNFPVI